MANRTIILSELATILGAELKGDPNKSITGIATLHQAQPEQVSFLANQRYLKHLGDTQAGAVIIARDYLDACPVDALIIDNPYLAYAKTANYFADLPEAITGIHPTASVADDCHIADSASIGAQCIIEPGAVIAEDAIIGPGSYIGHNVHVGKATRLWANVTVYHGVQIGERTVIHSGVVLGADGFGMAKDAEGNWLKIPQIGSVVVGDDVEIGANTTIDRGALGDTIIGRGVKLDNQIQVGHNVEIGEFTAIAACTGISGSVKIGKHCMISGMVGFTGHFEVADHVTITGATVVSKPLTKPGVYSSGTAIENHHTWRKNAVRFRQLDEMHRRIQQLEKQVNITSGESESQ